MYTLRQLNDELHGHLSPEFREHNYYVMTVPTTSAAFRSHILLRFVDSPDAPLAGNEFLIGTDPNLPTSQCRRNRIRLILRVYGSALRNVCGTIPLYSSLRGYPQLNSIIVATYENVRQILKTCLQMENCQYCIYLIVDEVHNLYIPGRGPSVYTSIQMSLCTPCMRLVMTSATVERPTRDFILAWTGAQLFSSDLPTVHVDIYATAYDGHYFTVDAMSCSPAVTPAFIKHRDALGIIADCLCNPATARMLVFVNTRQKTQQ
jgi:hypothetical protein